jgi:hypothetical protein
MYVQIDSTRGVGWQKCHACMVFLASDRTPDKIFRAYISGIQVLGTVFAYILANQLLRRKP